MMLFLLIFRVCSVLYLRVVNYVMNERRRFRVANMLSPYLAKNGNIAVPYLSHFFQESPTILNLCR